MRQRTSLGLALLAVGVLLAAAPSPARAVAALRHPTALGADPTAPLVAAATLLAWLLVLWLLAVIALVLLERLPGLPGRVAAAVAGRIAPRVVRRAVSVALGLSLGLAATGATAAYADTGALPRAAAAPHAAASLDWRATPGAPAAQAPATPSAALDWPASSSTPAAAQPAATAPDEVVVAPGDSLWSIAARALPTGADDTQVAQAWPSWWSANRDVIGDDPDLITPGTQLTPPPHTS